MENNRFEKLEERVVNWAKEKGILEKATPLAQIHKTLEEVNETLEAIKHQHEDTDTYINTKGRLCVTEEEIEDGIGDTFVTLLIQCKMQKLDPLKCLEGALDIIEKRTGKMVDGQFVKDA